jgi:hypothetical protein
LCLFRIQWVKFCLFLGGKEECVGVEIRQDFLAHGKIQIIREIWSGWSGVFPALLLRVVSLALPREVHG